MAKRQKTTRFSIQGWDARHYRTTDAYVQAVQSLYDKATLAITRAAARGKIDPDTPFSFDMYPSVQKEMQRITEQLAERVTVVIESGSKTQWLFACDKNDAFISSIMDTSKVSKARLKKMQDRNLDALTAFQGRKVDGMNLSQRVWKYVGQYKDQLENALDVGLGEGRSADELSWDVRQNLRDPNRLFRRVRDKRGNLVLSKRAAAFHPGRGVYRSSYKNAMRLTRSEINMAYRESDWQRWQSLDFVVGFEIHRSNHEPLCKCDTCAKLVGRYPKTFKFKGWHPQCMCYATPVLMDEETFDENELGDLKAALRGTTYKHQQAKNAVSDVPDGFKAWVKDHVEAQKGWASTPYFIKDNFVDGQLGKGLKIAMPTTTPAGKVDFHVPFDKLSVGEQLKFESEMANRNDDDWELLYACHLYGVDSAWYDSMCKEIYKHRQYWRVPELNAARDRLKAQVMAKIAEAKAKALQAINDYENAIKDAGEWIGDMSYKVVDARDMMQYEASEPYPNYISLLNSANGGSLDASRIRAAIDKVKADYAQAITDANACVAKCGDVDVSQLKALVAEKRTTARNALVIIKDIRNEIAKVEKEWNKKHNGVVKQSYTTNEELNETFKEINADFTTDKWFEHGDLVITPTTKSGVNGFTYMDGRISLKPKRLAGVKSAMGKIGQGKSEDITFEEADAMATFWHEITHNRNKPGNMYTTSTQTDVMEMMNEFVARKTLPEFYAKLGCPKTPHPELINNRDSTGYNRRVLGYDFVISKLGLDASKVLESAKKNLFALKYTKQETTAYQALMDGGLDKYKCPNGKAIGKAKINKIIAMCRKGYSTTTIEQYMKDEGIIADK